MAASAAPLVDLSAANVVGGSLVPSVGASARVTVRATGLRSAPRRLVSTLAAIALASLCIGLSACASRDPSRTGILEPHRIDLPQGNYVTREQVNRVRPGMSHDQVRFILGTPLLGQIFHDDRWDYIFSYRHPSGKTETRRVTVRFSGDIVDTVESDPLPEREDSTDPALPGFRPGPSAPATALDSAPASDSGSGPGSATDPGSGPGPGPGPDSTSESGSGSTPAPTEADGSPVPILLSPGPTTSEPVADPGNPVRPAIPGGVGSPVPGTGN